jgi:hypothetical protein
MEEAHDTYSLEDDVRGMDIHLGFEGTNSNGHREEIDKDVSMMKIIKNLQNMSKFTRQIKKGLREPRRNKKTSI